MRNFKAVNWVLKLSVDFLCLLLIFLWWFNCSLMIKSTMKLAIISFSNLHYFSFPTGCTNTLFWELISSLKYIEWFLSDWNKHQVVDGGGRMKNPILTWVSTVIPNGANPGTKIEPPWFLGLMIFFIVPYYHIRNEYGIYTPFFIKTVISIQI